MGVRKLSVFVSVAALLGPWLVGSVVRHHHAAALTTTTAALVGIALILKRPLRVEHLALPLFVAATAPSALVQSCGVSSRVPLVIVAGFVLASGVVWRMGNVGAQDGERSLSALLSRAFPEIALVAGAELRLFWFGLFRWRRNASDLPRGAEPFPATATGTEVALCGLTAFGFLVETPLMHILLARLCGHATAWACTGLHAILAVYLIGYTKSLLFRPTLLFADRLEIRLGVVARRIVQRAAIETVRPHDGETPRRPDEQRLFGLDQPNLRLGVAGGGVLLRVDDPGRLMRALAL